MHDSIKLADAVAAELNSGSFSRTFTAQRLLLPEFELAELTDLKVTVVPKGIEYGPFSRQWTRQELSVDIGIQQKLTGDVETELPGLLAFVQELVLFLRKRTLADFAEVTWLKIQNEPLYAPEHLANQRTFTSVLTVTYQKVS